MRMIDASGRELEVIQLDRGRGPVACIRISRRGFLVGPGSPSLVPGYYRSVDEALEHVDPGSLVEVIPLRP